MKVKLDISNIDEIFPENFSQEKKAKAKTLFLKQLAILSHKFYHGKIQVVPKVPVPGFNWFNVWYTPGVSLVSTTIRDNNLTSFELSNRGNMVAVVSDSTRVLGDGDCTPPGGLGVMEGKAYLMKYLGGIDAVPLCIDSTNADGKKDPDKIIEFVKMAAPSFGAVNLEDISQPNCYKVLDTLREDCIIPVWHDDAQGTASVTLAGLINALKLANKKIENVRIVMNGAGASNTTIARFILYAGADPKNMIMFDSRSSLHSGRQDIESKPEFYHKWNICQKTNPHKITSIEEALKGADVLIALSKPGPDTIKQAWIKGMADKAIVFVCANPVPEIYPYAAKEAGAFIVATGRGDFPNQVNNSIGFPGILKGTLLVRASKITDNMAIAASYSLADYAEQRGITPDDIIPKMDEPDIFAKEAADVAMQAVKDGVAREILSREQVYNKAKEDIDYARNLTQSMVQNGFIGNIPEEFLQEARDWAVKKIKGSE